ncbi:MAG: heparinase II/III family protein [Gemmatimonadales bacterium]|nr:heparinase II/III family protein [Gemmatimonadales bacterium]
MLSADQLASRKRVVTESAELSALLTRLAVRAGPLLERPLEPPEVKAQLTADGGVCPDDGSPLEFDPWRPSSHRCPACRREHSGSRHDRAWARWQHLWLAERGAELAALGVLAERADAATAAADILAAYAERYTRYPNRDNVLGPSRLFFSTYLESIWVTNYLGAAGMLREAGLLDPALEEGVSAVADEAANLIGEFDEGFSNRQTWHNAALAAIAVWFEDAELAGRAVEGPTGTIAHLVRGFGHDGMWYEGENYHLFALRGQLLAMGWAKQAGVDILADPRLAARLEGALRAPALTALPDLTFPARKDSRYGVSLAQPMYLELWEVGLARLGDNDSDLWDWLRALYASPPPRAERFDSYLHEAGAQPPSRARTRSDLSWWALLEMAPALAAGSGEWQPGNTLLEGQGLAILRRGHRYASLECGGYGGGHGHPDRLHLTLHANGRHWLPDPGAGSYVSRDLFWYRSTLAHNAPRLDAVSQPPGDAECAAFGESGEWAWARGVYDRFTRTVVAGPRYLLDVLECSAAEEHLVELPWHPTATLEIQSAGRWEPEPGADEYLSAIERFVPAVADGAVMLRGSAPHGATLSLLLDPAAHLVRATGPGLPGSGEPATFYLQRARGSGVRLVSVVEPADAVPFVRGWHGSGDVIEVKTTAGTDRHVNTSDGWEVTGEAGQAVLRGLRRAPAAPAARPLIDRDRRTPVTAPAFGVVDPAPLDGTLDGFDFSAPLALDHEDQYRRSEEPYAGPDEFSAAVAMGWDSDSLYVAVDVRKPELLLRSESAPALLLDNEPDDIHADGIQLYVRTAPDRPVYGFLLLPSGADGTIRVRVASGTSGAAGMVRGGWQPSETGYTLSAAVTLPEWSPRPGDEIGFDLLVNRVESGRERRSGQLVWSGGGGWIYLRGDRQDPASFGVLELR